MGKGRIFCLLGPSASGKDSLFQAILKRQPIPLSTVISYTTRPKRGNETEGVEYFFRDIPGFVKMRDEGRIIEYRCYHTVMGDWYYYTADDGQIDDRITDLYSHDRETAKQILRLPAADVCAIVCNGDDFREK